MTITRISSNENYEQKLAVIERKKGTRGTGDTVPANTYFTTSYVRVTHNAPSHMLQSHTHTEKKNIRNKYHFEK